MNKQCTQEPNKILTNVFICVAFPIMVVGSIAGALFLLALQKLLRLDEDG